MEYRPCLLTKLVGSVVLDCPLLGFLMLFRCHIQGFLIYR